MKKSLATLGIVAIASTFGQILKTGIEQRVKDLDIPQVERELSFAANRCLGDISQMTLRDYDISIKFRDSSFGSFTDARRILSVAKKIETDLPKLYLPLLLSFDEIVLGSNIVDTFCVNAHFASEKVPGRVRDIDDGKIFLDPDKYSFNLLVELAAKSYSKKVGDDFYGKWLELVDETVAYNKEIQWVEPMHGFLDNRGTKKCLNIRHTGFKKYGFSRWHEDVAIFVSESYKPDHGLYRRVNPIDSRYKEKLRLLSDYGFISEEQFSGVLADLGINFGRDWFSSK